MYMFSSIINSTEIITLIIMTLTIMTLTNNDTYNNNEPMLVTRQNNQ